MTELDAVGRDVLEARCAVLEHAVRSAATATPAQLDGVRPGSAENPDRSAMGWLYFFGALTRWHAMGPTVAQKRRVVRWNPDEIDDLRKALHAEPLTLSLASGARVSVYPKGEHAINEVAATQLALRWVVARRLALGDADPTPETIAAHGLALDAERQLNAEFVAIVCHPGAGIPWDESVRWNRPTPDFTRDLTSFDLVAIRRAYLEVNLLRVNAVAERARELANEVGDSLPIEIFMASLAGDMHLQPERLVREWSRGSLFSLAISRHLTTQHASEQAKEKADAERAR